MLNHEKIKWMTKASIYEKRAGNRDMKVNEYYLSDYVRNNLLKTLIGVTISVILFYMLFAVYDYEGILNVIAENHINGLLMEMLTLYVLVLILYSCISILYYTLRYKKCLKRLREYYRILKRIDKCKEQEDM